MFIKENNRNIILLHRTMFFLDTLNLMQNSPKEKKHVKFNY